MHQTRITQTELIHTRKDLYSGEEHHLKRDRIHHLERRRVQPISYFFGVAATGLVALFLLVIGVSMPGAEFIPFLEELPSLVGWFFLLISLVLLGIALMQKREVLIIEAGNTTLEIPFEEELYQDLRRDFNEEAVQHS